MADEARLLELRQRYVELKIAYWHAVAAGDGTKAEAIGALAKSVAKDLKFPVEQ